jgi:hypothetical protein
MTAGGPTPVPEEEAEVRTFGMPDEGSTDDEYDPNY